MFFAAYFIFCICKNLILTCYINELLASPVPLEEDVFELAVIKPDLSLIYYFGTFFNRASGFYQTIDCKNFVLSST